MTSTDFRRIGTENHHTRLYLTRRIEWHRFHNHTTTPWWPQNGPMGYQILYGYKGWWYNKMVLGTLYMGPLGNILLANTKTFYWECRLWLHRPRFQLALHIQCSGSGSVVCSFCIHYCTLCTTYQKRIWKRKNSGLCECAVVHSSDKAHKPESILFHILFWYVQHWVEQCTGVMQNFTESWHNF